MSDPNINNQMEDDQNEDNLWYDEETDFEDQKDAEEEENYERASNCTCGAWVISERGNVHHVADCYCGAG